MREIKFRAWEKHAKRMTEVTAFKWKPDHLYHQIYTRAIVNQKMIDEWCAYDFGGDSNGIILMQYTGLKDKNGVEIYEGDVVQIKDHAFHKKPGDYTGIEIDGFYPVSYTERMELVAGQWLLMHQLPYITVVGNIYENPELLENN